MEAIFGPDYVLIDEVEGGPTAFMVSVMGCLSVLWRHFLDVLLGGA